MKYQLRNQNEIHELLGVKNVEKLFEFIRKGALKKSELEKMSYDYNLNVSQTFQDCSEARERPFKILERLLDDWYEETLCQMTPVEARAKLVAVLESCCSSMVAISLKKGLETVENLVSGQ